MRDLVNRVTSYEVPDPGRIRVTEIAERNIEIDELVNPNTVTSSSFSDDERYLDTSTAKQLKIKYRSQRDAKQTKKL